MEGKCGAVSSESIVGGSGSIIWEFWSDPGADSVQFCGVESGIWNGSLEQFPSKFRANLERSFSRPRAVPEQIQSNSEVNLERFFSSFRAVLEQIWNSS